MVALMLVSALAPASLAAPVEAPRVAVVYSDFGNARHRDDYDATLAALRWPCEKIENTRAAELAERLASFDLLLCGALYNYGNPQDLSPGIPALRSYLEAGGALVITDANYAPHVDWLAQLGEGLSAGAAACHAPDEPEIVAPDHPLLGFPNPWRPRSMWSHLALGEGWQVLARDSDGGVVLAVAPVGLGFVWLSSNWALPPECLANIWEWARLRRAGLEVEVLAGATDLRPGRSRARLACRGLRRGATRATLSWHCEMGSEETVAERTVSLTSDGPTAVELTLPIAARGAARVWLTAEAGGAPYVSPATEAAVPELIVVERLSPAYRDLLLSGERDAAVTLAVTVYPGDENLAGAKLVAYLRAGDQARQPVETPLPTEYGARTTVRLPARGLPEGDVTVSLAATRGRFVVWRGSLRLRSVRTAPAVALDERLCARVGGEPFFPIGIYHVGPEALPQARAMGFNCLQAWGNGPEEARASLDAAQAHGMRVLLEASGLVRGGLQPEALRHLVESVRDHPALLAWYPIDEPIGAMAGDCEAAYRICRELDPDHPVYLVLCDPGLFHSFDGALDVLGIDPYPVPGASVRQVAEWMRSARSPRHPVWLIPQLHNAAAYSGHPEDGRAPTPAEEWCMVVQGLIYGAQGVIYYPWNDGACGLTHEPELMAELPRINAFLAARGAALAGSSRTLLVGLGAEAESPDLHAALFAGPSRVVLATNTGAEPARLATTVAAREGTDLRTGETVRFPAGRVELELAPLEVAALELH